MTRLGFFLVAILVVGLAANAAGTVGTVRAAPSGIPTFNSIYIVGFGSALVVTGYQGWTGAWQAVSNQSQIYADQLTLVAVGLYSYPVQLNVDTWESGYGWENNQSVTLQPKQETLITVTFIQDPSWHSFIVEMDGTPFVGQVATPISLLPPGIANIGGLDILTLGIISEGIVTFSAILVVNRWLMKRALFAPKFSLIVWGHVVLIAIGAAVLLDYQFIDQTFAGWSPLIYVFAVSPMWFLFSLSLFNRSELVELLQFVARADGEPVYRRWLFRTAQDRVGRTVLIRESWAGWLARLFGHHVVIDDGDPSHPKPFAALIDPQRSPTRSRRAVRFKDRFRLANSQDDEVARLMWTDTGQPVLVTWPRLTVHRWLPAVPAEHAPDGTVLKAAQPARRKLSLPHYTESKVELVLAPDHFRAAAMVQAGMANLRDLARVNAKLKTDLYATKANFSAQVEAEVEARLTAYYSLIGRTHADLTDEEAKAESERGQAYDLRLPLDEAKLGGTDR